MDVVALGELLIDFTENVISREIHYLRQIRVVHHAMYWQC